MKTYNLFGIKQPPNTRWDGSTGANEQGTAIFLLPAMSARAYFLNAENILRKTPMALDAFLATYAPTSDSIGSIPGNPPNDPDEYANFIGSRLLPLDLDTVNYLPLPTTRPDLWFAIAAWASQYETGKPPVWSQILLGLAAFLSLPHASA